MVKRMNTIDDFANVEAAEQFIEKIYEVVKGYGLKIEDGSLKSSLVRTLALEHEIASSPGAYDRAVDKALTLLHQHEVGAAPQPIEPEKVKPIDRPHRAYPTVRFRNSTYLGVKKK